MQKKKSILSTIFALLSLGFIFLYFIGVVNQPYYSRGFSWTLKAEGFLVTKVLPDTSASRAKLVQGDLVIAVNGRNSSEIFEISNQDLSTFLSWSGQIFSEPFSDPSTLTLELEDRRVLRVETSDLGFFARLPLVQPEVITNTLVGILIVLFGLWLQSSAGRQPAVGWFWGFALSAGPALVASYFNSYWYFEFIYFRFVMLDVFGVLAVSFLVGFARRFPNPDTQVPRLRDFWLMALPLVKFLAISQGVNPFRGLHYMIHGVLFISLGTTIVLFFRHYSRGNAGRRRKLRWVVAGSILSLVPYLVYVITIIIGGNVLNIGTSWFHFFATLSLLFLPVFIGLGIWRYNLFDIDRLLNRFFILFILGLILTLGISGIFYFFLESTLSLEVYLLLLATGIVSPFVYHGILYATDHIVKSKTKSPDQILVDMEEDLLRVTDINMVFPMVSSSLIQAYDPAWIRFVHGSGVTSHVLFSYVPVLESAPEVNFSRPAFNLAIGSYSKEPLTLELGPRRDEDIYTQQDLKDLIGAGSHLSKTVLNCELFKKLEESLDGESNAQRTAILSLAKLTEYRDHETGRHLERIQEYTRILAQALKDIRLDLDFLTKEYIDDLVLSSVLHDIGKVGVPDSILLKPGKLTPEEFGIIKTHTIIGGKVLEEAEAMNPNRTFLTLGKMVCYHHHEKWDGSGYPYGLSGEDIPFSARIVSLADVYDALRSERPYKASMSHTEALAIITESRGSHFDPQLTDVFLAIEDEIARVPRGE